MSRYCVHNNREDKCVKCKYQTHQGEARDREEAILETVRQVVDQNYRLADLVKQAYHEGWYDGVYYGVSVSAQWEVSAAREVLLESLDSGSPVVVGSREEGRAEGVGKDKIQKEQCSCQKEDRDD